jgi:hypothetical protein
MTSVSRTFTLSVVAANPTVPQWWTSLAERTWTDIAGGTAYSGAAWQQGSRFVDVVPNPLPTGAEGQVSIITAYTTAAVLQGRGEYLKIAEGGHNSYYGNEIYALCLKDAVPSWKRIWGPTPNSLLNTTTPANYNDPYQSNNDGTPRSGHGWRSRCTTEGPDGEHLWIFLANASAAGLWTTDVWSIPRTSLGVGVVTPSLWVYHGRAYPDVTVSEINQYYFQWQSASVTTDSVGDSIIVVPEADIRATGIGTLAKKVDVTACLAAGPQSTSGPEVPGATAYLAPSGNSLTANGNAWAVIPPNCSPRCLIKGAEGVLRVFNLETPSVYRTKTVTGTLPTGANINGVYHSASRKVILGGGSSSTVQTLSIPADPWNATTGFTVGSLTTAGGSISSIVTSGTNGQFQMIEDMGDGRSCVVYHCRNVTQPTYVYKLPASF